MAVKTATKKQKLSSSSSKQSLSRLLSSIAEIENTLADALKSNGSLNPLNDLLQLAQSTSHSSDVVLKAIFALYRSFTLIIRKGILSSINAANDEEGEHESSTERKAVRTWVTMRLEAYTSLLSSLLQDEEKTLRLSALKILFSLLRQLSSGISTEVSDPSSSTPLQFDVPYFQKIVRALLLCPSSPRATKKHKSESKHNEIQQDVKDLFLDTWLNVYADIRWFFLRESSILLENHTLVSENPYLPINTLSILEKLTGMPSSTPQSDPKQQFWIEALNTKPKLKKKGKGKSVDEDEEEDEDDMTNADQDVDDWRKFFEDPKPEQTKTSGSRRLYTLPIHAQLHTPAAHRAVFTRAWLSLLPLLSSSLITSTSKDSDTSDSDQDNLHLSLISRSLIVLHQRVLPYLTRPVLIMDWVSSHVSLGGYTGLLSLNTLFTLMTTYNLDYPSFYTRLYAYLDRRVLHNRHRARFFRLTERFLGSTHLPAALLASFVKRLSRLTLSAPPAAIIMAIPFTYNILKKHPALMCMIHNVNVDDKTGYVDPFNMAEVDPMKTGALQSSLWELYSHKNHYHGPAATLARILEEAFTRPGFAMEDFLDHTYSTLFETEINRRIRKEPAVIEKEFFEPIVLPPIPTIQNPKDSDSDSDSNSDVAAAELKTPL